LLSPRPGKARLARLAFAFAGGLLAIHAPRRSGALIIVEEAQFLSMCSTKARHYAARTAAGKSVSIRAREGRGNCPRLR